MTHEMDQLNGLALCAGIGGIGGIELAAERAIRGYRTVCYVEKNLAAAAILASRMEEKAICKAPIWDDIKSFDGHPWCGVVDIVTAGFPCQPFSCAGKQRGTDDERWIWPDIARIIREVRPGFVFLENVTGVIQLGLSAVLEDFAALGFHAKWCCLPASAVGAPHERDRFFCLANAHGARLSARSCGEGGEIRDQARRQKSQRRSSEISDAACMLRQEIERHESNRSLQSNGKVSNPDRSGCALAKERGVFAGTPGVAGIGAKDWWNVEPDVGRVAHGIPSRVDRLKCLGNAVVPAQAEYALKILVEYF